MAQTAAGPIRHLLASCHVTPQMILEEVFLSFNCPEVDTLCIHLSKPGAAMMTHEVGMSLVWLGNAR